MRRHEVIPALVAALTAGLPAGTPVMSDNLSAAAKRAAEEKLNEPGHVVTVMPLLASSRSGQAGGGRLAEKVLVAVHVRANQLKIDDADVYQLQDAVIDTVLAAKTSELNDILAECSGDDFYEIQPADTGCLTHAIRFLIPIAN